MTFEWRFLHESFKDILAVKKVRRLTLYLWQPWCPAAYMFLLFASAYEILNAVASLLNKPLWLGVTWRTIYETRFSRPKDTRAATMSLTNSDPLSLWMILGNLKYENTCILIPFATTRAFLDTNGNITWNLENDRQRDIYSDTDHQAYSAYQSNRSKISTIDNIFIEIFAAISHWIPSFLFFFF